MLAASGHSAEESLGEIRFLVGSSQVGLNLSSGEITDGSAARAEIVCNEDILGRIVRGVETLQSAFRQGRVSLSGDPEPFLRLAIVLDRSAALKLCAH